MSRSAILRAVRIVCSLPILAVIVAVTYMLCAMAMHDTGWAVASLIGAAGVAIIFLLLRWIISDRTWLFDVIASSGVTMLLVALLLPAVQTIHCDVPRASCANNLKQIMLGIHYYYDVYKRLPPAHTSDAQGKILHSWRAQLLPYVDQEQFYAQYDFNSAWNSKSNSPLAATSPSLYRCNLSEAPKSDTNYLAITGAETIWPDDESITFSDILDGASNTIAIVESHQTGIKWTEPRDLTFRNMNWQINGAASGSEISSLHPGGAQVGLTDGSTRFMSETIDPEVLRALLTAKGGEELTDNSW